MSTQNNKVTLYIATHNKTGKKYFGKTTRYFTQESLQSKYHGSGTYWKKHLKKHGDDVTMEIYGIYNIDEVKEVALQFSKENKIVESNEYANLIYETGLEGGSTLHGELHHNFNNKNRLNTKTSDIGRNNMRLAQIGKKHSEITKIKMSKVKLGIKKSKEHIENMKKPKSKEHIENMKKPKNYENGRKIESIKNNGYFQLNNSNKIYTLSELSKISKNLYKTNENNKLGQTNKSKAMLKRYKKEHLIGTYIINRYKRVEI